ncbi:interleukin-1 receptor-like 2 isoform X1 [Notechis scutatus]|uniref:Interleukin-1 receptor-like 2 isoform X1 n=1 Tax=Notechis scutatus TaxID=8663 RepID=A0A6J1U1P9_9SAUR|nr:interleukin-1 receptor-like 2 isoform X1 [Notechis scutatus]XP_026522563.1 interleukin-1 receptor-like 2 isoform X1 [Notechis scutatus]XP_026522564.1 interleukin-1 receptor-like 2 isoform X1 [Notechis scutatus]
MKPALVDYCILVLSFICVLKSEKCVQEYIGRQKMFEENNPFRLDCLIRYERANSTLNWYMNGNDTPLIAQPFSRVFQQKNSLWFIPAIAQDSGLYQCIISYRNSTRCYKYSVSTAVLNNSAGLCFNEKYYLKQTLFPRTPSRVVCHQVNEFGQEVDYLSIHWYKECEPVQGEQFEFFRNHLIMKDPKKDDEGKYVCKGIYTFRGNKYNFSNSILVDLIENLPRKRPEILYPINNTIEADVGSNVFTECNVSSFKDNMISISWRVNNTLVDNLFKGRIIEGNQTNIPKEGAEIFIVSLNITELKNEDYDQHFTCHAGEVAAYIKIQHPTKNHAAFVILILLLIIPVLICVLFKIEIVLWYRKSCHPFFHKKVSDGKIYDAYVLYPKLSSQVDFVLKVLPDVLEKQCGYSLFIPGRDDLPGKALVNVVDDTIVQCRRLIMILVPGLSSLEEAPEQNIAVYHALIPDGMKTILIEMSKIKDYSHMPESIRYIKQKQGAIRWKGDIMKKNSSSANSSFWKKVRYRMPSEHQASQELALMPVPSDVS